MKENTYPYLFEEGKPIMADETKINMTSEILIIGGDRQLSNSKTPDETGIAFNRNHVFEIFPFLNKFNIKRIWAGLMPFTSNLEPIIGKIPQHDNLYIVTGLSSSGFEQGPMSGKLLADQIHNGKASSVLSSADPVLPVTFLTKI